MHLDTVWVYSSFSVSLPPKHTPIFMLILWPDTHKIPREDSVHPEAMHVRTATHTPQAPPVLAAVAYVTVSEEIKAPFRRFFMKYQH